MTEATDKPVALEVRQPSDLVSASIRELQAMDGGEAMLRAVSLAQQMRAHGISKLTDPEDWIANRDKQGGETAFIAVTGVAKLKAPYGLYRKALVSTGLEPQRIHSEDGSQHGWNLRFIGGSTALNLEDEFEVVRWDHEKFLGRDDIPSDPKASVTALSWSKIGRDLIGLKGVPVATLREAGLDVARCRKGSGYGTSQDRQAQQVTDPAFVPKVREWWEDVLRRTGGDESAAKTVLREATSYPAGKNKEGKEYKAFAGATSYQQITQQRGLDRAWKTLKEHPVFGDKTGEREPGEDG